MHPLIRLIDFETLKGICRLRGIKFTKRLTRIQTLRRKFHRENSIVMIQRWWRQLHSYNPECPITLCLVVYPCWGFKIGYKRHYYNLPYLLGTFERGEFKDPMTRSTLTRTHILEICSAGGLGANSPLLSRYDFLSRNMIDTSDTIVLELSMRVITGNVIEIIREADNQIIGEVAETGIFEPLFRETREYSIHSHILRNSYPDIHYNTVQWSYNLLANTVYHTEDARSARNSFIAFLHEESDWELELFPSVDVADRR
jgi:hypothetical protein